MYMAGMRTVLIVDDEATIRENLDRLLKGNGYATTLAADGQEALDAAAGREFDVVLLDIRMPHLSGMDVLRRLHEDHPDTAVIMVTAVADDVTTAVETMKLGAYDYVMKPFNLGDVLIRVEKARERRFLALQVKNYQMDMEKRLAEQAEVLHEMMTQTAQAQREVHGLSWLLQRDVLWVQEMRERLQKLRKDVAATPEVAGDPAGLASRYTDLKARIDAIADFANTPPV